MGKKETRSSPEKYIIRDRWFIKCKMCNSLYQATKRKERYGRAFYYEQCPVCGCDSNYDEHVISVFRYKFIRWWRGITDGEDFNRTDG